MIARSLAVPSSVTKMVSYMIAILTRVSCANDDVPGYLQRFRQTVKIHAEDQNSARPPRSHQEPAILPRAHTLFRTGELQKRKHGKRKLQRKYYLTEGEQICDTGVTMQANDEYGGNDGEAARNQTPNPRLDTPVHEAFHHDLAG